MLSISTCPFCGHQFSDEDRELIQAKLNEKDENGEYKLPGFRILCSGCNAEIALIRKSKYEWLEDD